MGLFGKKKEATKSFCGGNCTPALVVDGKVLKKDEAKALIQKVR